MMDPSNFTAPVIAALTAVKAFEKIGHHTGDAIWESGDRLVAILQNRFPKIVKSIQEIAGQENGDSKNQQIKALASEVEQAMENDRELKDIVTYISKTVQSSEENIQNMYKVAEKVGFLIQGGNSDFRQSTFNF
ncbi:hypothetical protein [Geitlerinema sp. PCC 9228]|uniref:hypothetical protein n=1 Tax=Geitlerinema sp. PCC 9228 TaxID=111611 RepID=UPI0008F994A8|nr:hypothetical protein [Geitlerinema sp. PCC 9228]